MPHAPSRLFPSVTTKENAMTFPRALSLATALLRDRPACRRAVAA